MAKKICLQAGHNNVKYNSIVTLRGSTGAPNEAQFNLDIMNRLASELRKRGFEVITTDANGNDDPAISKTDFDLFVSIHYDADVYGKGGGFADFCDPAKDMATVESQRITAIFNDTYFKTTGIAYINHSNKNTRGFYMWRNLTQKTPCVLIECGVGMHKPDDYEILFNNRPLVVEGLCKSVCKAFGVAYTLEKTIEQKLAEAVDRVGLLERTLADVNRDFNACQTAKKELEAKLLTVTNLEAKLSVATNKIIQIKNIIG